MKNLFIDRVYRKHDFSPADLEKLADGKAFSPTPTPNPAASNPNPAPNPNQNPAPNPNPAPNSNPNPAPAPNQNPNPAPTAENGKGSSTNPDTFQGFDYRTRGFNTVDELIARLDQYSTLEKKLKDAEAAPKFKSPRQEWLYNFANKYEGMELEAAQLALHLERSDLNKLSDHEVRFEVFKLKPENKGLTQGELEALFIDNEKSQFGDPTLENGQTEAQKIKSKQATLSAKAELQKIKDEFSKTRAVEPTPEELVAQQTAYRNHVKQSLANLDGLELKLNATDEAGKRIEGKMNFKLSPEQMNAVIEGLVDPQNMWGQMLQKSEVFKADGSVQVPNFFNIITRMMYFDEIINQTYDQGRNDERSDVLKNQRQNKMPNDHNNSAPGPGSGGKTKEQLAADAALKTVGQ